MFSKLLATPAHCPTYPFSCPPCAAQALQALEAGTLQALPDGVRVELEGIQEGGGLQHLQEVAQEIKVRMLVESGWTTQWMGWLEAALHPASGDTGNGCGSPPQDDTWQDGPSEIMDRLAAAAPSPSHPTHTHTYTHRNPNLRPHLLAGAAGRVPGGAGRNRGRSDGRAEGGHRPEVRVPWFAH